MQKVLIINGHQKFPYNEGRLNQTLMNEMAERLKDDFDLKTSILQKGWDVEEEVKKFEWADIIIFQTPVYWFSVPALLKKYMEEVYLYGIFYKGASTYGNGGQFKNKKYMLSTTWNAPKEAFDDPAGFFEGRSTDDILVAFHKTQQFTGMQALPSFSCHNVVHQPNIEAYLTSLRQHLHSVFNV